MNEDLSSGILWNKAVQAGILLAAVTIAFSLLDGWVGKLSFFGAVLSTLLTLAKIAACIYLLWFFFSRLKQAFPKADYQTVRGYGLRIALCSSLLVAAYSLFTVLSDGGEITEQAIAAARESLENFGIGIDANMAAQFEKLGAHIPLLSFISMFLYCYLWGWLLSPVLARKVAAPSDPFADLDPGNGDDKPL